MTAYCAVYLVTVSYHFIIPPTVTDNSAQLLRSRTTKGHLPLNAEDEIYGNINKVADTYSEYADTASGSSSALYHSRFLRSLVQNDITRSERAPMMMVVDGPSVNGEILFIAFS